MKITYNGKQIRNKVGSNQYVTRHHYVVRTKKSSNVKLHLAFFLSLIFFFTCGNTYFNISNFPPKAHAEILSPLATSTEEASPSARLVNPDLQKEEKPKDRLGKLKIYLEKYNSPLLPYAEYIVKVSDEYDISYTLIPSIAFKESTLGKAIPQGSHNAWGIMAWDSEGNRSVRRFNSWNDSIKYEAALLSNNYRANMNNAIQEKYCPSFECSETWVEHVTNAQKEINN